MRTLYVWQLQFDDEKALEHAFHALMQADDLDTCSAEPDELRIRFTAAIDRGQKLVAAIYDLGQLRWCSRHEVAPGATVTAASRAALP